MSDVEALLSVDAGRIPPGTLAFFRKHASLGGYRALALLSGAAGIAGVATACAHGNHSIALLLLISAALLAVLSTPTEKVAKSAAVDDGDPEGNAAAPMPRQVILVTDRGVIGRDEQGLRSWQFEDLSSVFTGGHAGRPHLVLVERSGVRHAIDYTGFCDGESLREVIDSRLRRS